jgi:hypothetical protein
LPESATTRTLAPMGDRSTREEPASAPALALLVADDSEPFRARLGALVASGDGMVVVGNATDVV